MSIARYFAYTDSGAPQITGQQGTLKELLKKILVGTAGVAYGTGVNEKPSLGWSIEYEATAKAIFKGAVGSSGMLLRVNDDGPGAGSYREAFVYGCESASDVDTVTDRFPTSAQISGGQVWRKSNNLNSTAIPWWMWGDDRTFYLFMQWYSTLFTGVQVAGDIDSIKSGDAFNFFLGGGTSINNAAQISDVVYPSTITLTQQGAGTSLVAARSHDQATKSPAIGLASVHHFATKFGNAGPAYPASVSGGLVVAPIEVHENNMPRGVLRGAYCPLHASGLTDLQQVTGVDGFPGATFHVAPAFGNSQGRIVIASGIEWG